MENLRYIYKSITFKREQKVQLEFKRQPTPKELELIEKGEVFALPNGLFYCDEDILDETYDDIKNLTIEKEIAVGEPIEDIKEKLDDLLREGLTDKEFWDWAGEWLDPEVVFSIVDAWDEDVIRETWDKLTKNK